MLNEFEQAIVDKITTIADFKTIKGYEGEFARQTYKEILGLMPCALIVYEGGDFDRQNLILRRRMRWTVIVGCESMRKKDKARQKVYELLEKTKEALNDVIFADFEMKPLQIKRERLIYHDDRIVVFGQVYETEVREEA